MTTPSFYSDRINGAVPLTHEELPEATADGLKALVRRRIDANYLAEEFPSFCTDGNNIEGTNRYDLGPDITALIPGATWPLWQEPTDDTTLFDIVEYTGQRVSKPSNGRYHDFLRHFELSFDRRAGRTQFREEVNVLLRRGGTVFEMNSAMQIQRVGTPELRAALRALRPDTGDATLDDLLESARDLYLSRNPADRTTAIEKFWDGFSRLKSIDVPGKNKVRQSVAALLSNISDEPFRAFIESEMTVLTDFGNQFQIRHHEVGQTPIPTDAQDYIVSRMANLIVFLLDQSGRLAP
ncbi:MAG: hypothetical protein EOO27_38770 [Comamonadaceae bacterium]|nr:MAG: hypothetical protein EOO27_38770 [Comamonadaceae bacterium]